MEKFYLEPSSERPVALISAGVGLTPMVSTLNAIIETGSSRPTWFILGARSSHEHAFGDHVHLAAQEHEHVQVLINYSQPQPEDVQGKDYDGTDFINADLLKQVLPDLDFDFFFCGPPPFMKSLFNDLSDLGVPETGSVTNSSVQHRRLRRVVSLKQRRKPQRRSTLRLRVRV